MPDTKVKDAVDDDRALYPYDHYHSPYEYIPPFSPWWA